MSVLIDVLRILVLLVVEGGVLVMVTAWVWASARRRPVPRWVYGLRVIVLAAALVVDQLVLNERGLGVVLALGTLALWGVGAMLLQSAWCAYVNAEPTGARAVRR